MSKEIHGQYFVAECGFGDLVFGRFWTLAIFATDSFLLAEKVPGAVNLVVKEMQSRRVCQSLIDYAMVGLNTWLDRLLDCKAEGPNSLDAEQRVQVSIYLIGSEAVNLSTYCLVLHLWGVYSWNCFIGHLGSFESGGLVCEGWVGGRGVGRGFWALSCEAL